MKTKMVDLESIRAQAMNVLMALKTRQELEAALNSLNEIHLTTVVGFEEDGTPVTKQQVLADYHQDWKDHAEGKTISNAEMMKWLEEELGTSVRH